MSNSMALQFLLSKLKWMKSVVRAVFLILNSKMWTIQVERIRFVCIFWHVASNWNIEMGTLLFGVRIRHSTVCWNWITVWIQCTATLPFDGSNNSCVSEISGFFLREWKKWDIFFLLFFFLMCTHKWHTKKCDAFRHSRVSLFSTAPQILQWKMSMDVVCYSVWCGAKSVIVAAFGIRLRLNHVRCVFVCISMGIFHMQTTDYNSKR